MLTFTIPGHSTADWALHNAVDAAFGDSRYTSKLDQPGGYVDWAVGIHNDDSGPSRDSLWRATTAEAELWLMLNMPAEVVVLEEPSSDPCIKIH